MHVVHCLRWVSAILLTTLCLTVQSADDPGREVRRKLLREQVLDHFMLGIEAPIEWMNETRDKNGAKWDARIQYFSGGAAKNSWDTVFLEPWNKYVNPNKERGTWGEKMFIKPTVENGYMPWITFYNLAQSYPADYKPGPAQATPANAKVPATMKAYFEQFKLLMQLCDKHKPKPIVVQIEPDEWGHLLISGKMDPAGVDVKVGSCGMPELKDLPDNLIGYAHALKRLRDLYAPMNVLLACNPSGWDSKGSMSGKKFGEYLLKCGCNEWELAVFETGDRDKGMHGKAPPYGDVAGVTGSFDNHIQWISEFHQTTGLYVFVWQVAVGNTFFATCDNTPGHYCDNLAQTLLENYPQNPTIARYVQAGCAGFMFNAGQGDSTHVFDARKDGITNPSPCPGNAGNKSEYADDDGGYLRLRAAAYYKKPFPILGKVGSVAAKSSPGSSSSGSSSSDSASASAPAAAAAKPAAPAPAKLKISDKLLAEWDGRLRQKAAAILKTRSVQCYLRLFGPKSKEEKFSIVAADENGLTVDVSGNKMPVSWKNLSVHERAALGRALASDDDDEALLAAAVFAIADEQPDQASEFLARAAIKNASAAQDLKAQLAADK
jgi:hypothetical protein